MAETLVAKADDSNWDGLKTDAKEIAMAKSATVGNQRAILSNQRRIIANQKKLDRILANQARILANQKKILAKKTRG